MLSNTSAESEEGMSEREQVEAAKVCTDECCDHKECWNAAKENVKARRKADWEAKYKSAPVSQPVAAQQRVTCDHCRGLAGRHEVFCPVYLKHVAAQSVAEQVESGDGLPTSRKVAITTNAEGHKEVKRIIDQLQSALTEIERLKGLLREELREPKPESPQFEPMGYPRWIICDKHKWMEEYNSIEDMLAEPKICIHCAILEQRKPTLPQSSQQENITINDAFKAAREWWESEGKWFSDNSERFSIRGFVAGASWSLRAAQSQPVPKIDLLAWVSKALEVVQLYRYGYQPHDVADGLLEKYRQWDIPDKYRLSEYKPCESSASEAQPLALPAECVECGKAEGPVITVGADCLGWLCPECYGKLQQLGVEAQREEEPQASPVEMPEPLDGFEEWWEPFRSNLPPTTDALRNASFCQVAEAAWKACKLWAEAARKDETR